MRAALIGAGRFGQNHLRTLHEIGALAAVAEIGDQARQKAADDYGTTVFASHQDLIASKPEAVVIATPAHTHFAVAKDCLEAGIPCLVEKPLTLDVAEGEELARLADAKGTVLMVGHLLIYQPAIQAIKQLLDSGAIGTLKGLHQERLNLGKARNQENALWSLGVHDVAVALYLIGSAPEKTTFVGQSMLNPGVEDDTYLHLAFAEGVQAHIHSSWHWPELRRHLVLVGDMGMLVFDEPASTVWLHKKRIDPSTLANEDGGVEEVFKGSGAPLKLELEHFFDCIRTGAKPKSDGWSGVEALRVLAAAK